jgi:hypothetical protein
MIITNYIIKSTNSGGIWHLKYLNGYITEFVTVAEGSVEEVRYMAKYFPAHHHGTTYFNGTTGFKTQVVNDGKESSN